MKDSYVADINDFFKYDLLEKISKGKKCLVVWMKTIGEGNKLSYLENNKFKVYNPKLFVSLNNIINDNKRTLKDAANIESLSNCQFIEGELTKKNRELYFKNVYEKATEVKIVFFDPDNGISPNDNKKDKKYIYWDEIKKIWDMPKDVLIYQSYRRINHEQFISGIEKECKQKLKGSNVYTLITKGTFFVYISHKKTKELENINKEWSELEI